MKKEISELVIHTSSKNGWSDSYFIKKEKEKIITKHFSMCDSEIVFSEQWDNGAEYYPDNLDALDRLDIAEYKLFDLQNNEVEHCFS